MIDSFCDRMRTQLKEEIETRRNELEQGTDRDERMRGEIWAFRRSIALLDYLEDRARKQNDEM